MAGNLEKECSALGGLFQCIVNDMKNGYPVWEDFVQKATKMHMQLKAAAAAVSVFLDALQRVADLATGAKGATRDIGTVLTRICLRHRSIENRLKTMTSALIDCLLSPLQEKLDEWRRAIATLDKDHSREYKRARNEIKKRSVDSGRLQKKVRKGQNSMQRMLDSAVQEVNDRYFLLLETEQKAVRQALTEQRSQFCIFVSWFKPFLDGEVALLNEISQLQEVTDLLYKHSADPYTLPPSSEAVITDAKGLENTWRFQTPPSSPGSSLGSRKSSYCSLGPPIDGSVRAPSQASSLVSTPIVNVQKEMLLSPRFSSISSQDSGFKSQDALYRAVQVHSSSQFRAKACAPDEVSTVDSGDEVSQVSTPSVSPSAFTWPECGFVQPPYVPRSPLLPQRPRTISAAFYANRASLPKRPAINSATYTPTIPPEALKGSPKTRRSSSQDPAMQRPPLPQKYKPFNAAQLAPISILSSSDATPHTTGGATSIPDFNQMQPNQIIPPSEYASINKKVAQFACDSTLSATSAPKAQRPRRPMSFACSDENVPFVNLLTRNEGRDYRMTMRDDEEGIITPLAVTPPGSNTPSVMWRSGSLQAPPPPVRRSSSITAATPSAPAIDLIRSFASVESSEYAVVPDAVTRSQAISSSKDPGLRQTGTDQALEYASTGYQLRGSRADSEPPIPKRSN